MQESEKPLQFQRNGKNKKYKKISIAWYHNVLTDMFTISEKSVLL